MCVPGIQEPVAVSQRCFPQNIRNQANASLPVFIWVFVTSQEMLSQVQPSATCLPLNMIWCQAQKNATVIRVVFGKIFCQHVLIKTVKRVNIT